MQGTVDTRIPYLTSLSYLQTQNLNQENAKSQEALATSIEHISTGLRVIDASDDLAGFAIADRFDVQIQGMSKALQNTNEALSATRIAEGSLNEYIDILGYMNELAEKASHNSTTNNERMSLQEQIDNLQDRLKQISTETSFRGRKLLDGTYRTQDIQVGASIGQILSVSIKSARPDQIGLHEILSGGTMNSADYHVGPIYSWLDTGVSTDDSITIQGHFGAEYIEFQDYSTAKQIAAFINEKSDMTGVNAKAVSYAKIYDLSRAGDISFTLYGSSEAQISATITSTSDLSPLYEDISSHTAATHIAPELSPDGTSIKLYASEGDNIGIEDFNHSEMIATLKLIGMDAFGQSTNGMEAELDEFAQPSVLVGGYVQIQSESPFILFTGDGEAIFSTTNSTKLPTLKALDTIDISSQEGANDALSIIENATSYVKNIKSDIQAYENGFETIIERLEFATEQMEDSKHRVVDANLAEETLNSSRATIQIQSQNALITQASKLIPEYSLFLLRQ